MNCLPCSGEAAEQNPRLAWLMVWQPESWSGEGTGFALQTGKVMAVLFVQVPL